ncbi:MULTISPECIES: VF530 family protein [unclassified Undibacterium]|uniref:VF530 family protein n=1 Tax=unclassified Undibacterium TaxID=2630295 RepID=UPI002AC9CDD7|nr:MULTISPECIES: VF530 family protein [unclassified Undibacterium]MEB0138283.1 VF530 family protein [Undibacterium sp. CCC2.1]MEB0170769.1 VF530 family protein [Undibacterium sp. CCC1.1]MEB0174658.1 VF530 family protein [Undibacterium sp. CCC3.4]MEB0213855.1 VF530 family protein [Undibacterium sp. 5I2]WPX42581.1 VF530 family protein [Undibacterium sp. CCC3.4]
MTNPLSDLAMTPPQTRVKSLEGISLEAILTTLLEQHGWSVLAQRIPIRCFEHDPSIKSSLRFLRKTAWARSKVEQWYLQS